jgi:hypothetical protein
LVKGGTLGGQSFSADLANGGEAIEINPDSKLAADVSTAAQDAITGISNGTIKVPLP